MDIVTLRDGTETPLPLVSVVMYTLRNLCKNDPMAFYDVVMMTRQPGYKPFGKNGTTLHDLALLEQDGSVAGGVDDVIRNAVVGDGFEMRIVSPMEAHP